jgi:hypothetical protein
MFYFMYLKKKYYLSADSAYVQFAGHKFRSGHIVIFDMIYLLTAIGLRPRGSSTVHIYPQTIHGTTQLKTLVGRLSGIRTQSGQTKINDELTA